MVSCAQWARLLAYSVPVLIDLDATRKSCTCTLVNASRQAVKAVAVVPCIPFPKESLRAVGIIRHI